jgi:hypothetical protein
MNELLLLIYCVTSSILGPLLAVFIIFCFCCMFVIEMESYCLPGPSWPRILLPLLPKCWDCRCGPDFGSAFLKALLMCVCVYMCACACVMQYIYIYIIYFNIYINIYLYMSNI